MSHTPRRASAPVVTLLCAALAQLALAHPLAAKVQTGGASDPSPAVETIAGPGFCPGAATLDGASRTIGAIAADLADGSVHYEAGPPGSGQIVHVEGDGRTGAIPTGLTARSGSGLSLEGRLASDRHGGVVMATAGALVHLAKGKGPAGIAGSLQGGGPGGGDGGMASAARFGGIGGIASDEAGNLYVSDAVDGARASFRVRVVNRGEQPLRLFGGTPGEVVVLPGAIGAVAGSEVVSPTSTVAAPTLAVASGRLYIGTAVRAVSPGADSVAAVKVINLGPASIQAHGATVAAGAVHTLVGPGSTNAGANPLSSVSAIAADGEGNVYVAEESVNRVLRLDSAGVLSVFAGTAEPSSGGFNGNGRPAVGARLDRPFDVEVGAGRRVYIADRGNGQVRYVDAAGTIRAALGNSLTTRWICQGGPANATAIARPGGPQGMAVDPEGNVYVAVGGLGQVKRIEASGRSATVAGTDSATPACAVGQARCAAGGRGSSMATRVKLGQPVGVALGARGALYVLDQSDGRVHLVNVGSRPLSASGARVAPGAIETVAGSSVDGHGGDGGPATDATLDSRRADARLSGNPLAADQAGNLFIADGDRVRMVDPQGRISTFRFLGTSTSNPTTCCASVTGLAVDATGNLYIAQTYPGRVFVVNRGNTAKPFHGQTVAPGEMVAVAGNGDPGEGGFGGDGGPALEAQLAKVAGIAVDGRGDLYIVSVFEVRDQSVRRVDAGGTISTAVGTGRPGFNGDGLDPALTDLLNPTDVAVDRCGNLLVADTQNDRVRRVTRSSCESAAPDETRGQSRGARPLLAILVMMTIAIGVIVVRTRLPARRSKRADPDSQ